MTLSSSSTIDFSVYPPGPVLMIFELLDQIYSSFYLDELFGGNWRSMFPSSSYFGWLDLKFQCPPPMDVMPDLLPYKEYMNMNMNTTNYYDISSMYSFAFETKSTTLCDVTSPLSILILLVLIMSLRFLKSKLLVPSFTSLGRKLGRMQHGLEWEHNNEVRIVKFGEYVFRLLFHVCIASYGIIYFSNQPWWKEDGTKTLWMKYPHDAIEPGMSWYYLIQCAYNIDALLSLLKLSFTVDYSASGLPKRIGWSTNVRGDFREMLVHHLVTNALVIGSSRYRLTRVGSMVFMVHDISDVPVDFSKLANFMKWKAATAACFFTMVVLWFIFRLSVLPFVIYKSVLYEAIYVLEDGLIDPKMYLAYWYFFVLLLAAIILLHATWFLMFIKMGYYLIFKGEAHDFSEHKKGEKQTKKNQ